MSCQVVGGSGFIISSTLFMLETQEKWYLPAPKLLGWHIGFWNLVGGIGFTLCGALGFGASDASVAYASTLATFIGSWAFLVSHQPRVPHSKPRSRRQKHPLTRLAKNVLAVRILDTVV